MDGICGNFFMRSTKFDSIRMAACVKYFAQGLKQKGGKTDRKRRSPVMWEGKGKKSIKAPVRQGKGDSKG